MKRYPGRIRWWWQYRALPNSKKSVFVDEVNNGGGADLEEKEANEWASKILVPRREWKEFIATSPRSQLAVRTFAERQGVAPGIVVGMLQHEGLLPWTHLNGLKVRLEWQEAE